MSKLKHSYLKISLFILIVEILIAIFMHDSFIRPFFGDFLAVILVYYFIKSFFEMSNTKIAIISISIAYILESLQYFNFLEITGLAQFKIAGVILGNSFAWADILAYTLGISFVLIFEKIILPKSIRIQSK
jgi:Protein of unknown function (DUF2809)